MALGPGKYDGLCTYVRETTEAMGAAVIIWEDAKGAGFSVQAPPALLAQLPSVLRYMADTMESHKNDVHSGDGIN